MFKIEQHQNKPTKEKMDVDEEKAESPSGSDEEEEDDDDEVDDDEQLKTGSEKLLLTAVGIGYHNLTKTLI